MLNNLTKEQNERLLELAFLDNIKILPEDQTLVFAMELLINSHGAKYFRQFNDEITQDENLVQKMLERDYHNLKYLTDYWLNNKSFMKEQIKKSFISFQYATKELQEDEKFFMEMVHVNKAILELGIAEKHMSFKNIKALIEDDCSLIENLKQYVLDKDWPEVIDVCIENNILSVYQLNKNFLNKEQVLKVLSKSLWDYSDIPQKFRQDIDVFISAINHDDFLNFSTNYIVSEDLREVIPEKYKVRDILHLITKPKHIRQDFVEVFMNDPEFKTLLKEKNLDIENFEDQTFEKIRTLYLQYDLSKSSNEVKPKSKKIKI